MAKPAQKCTSEKIYLLYLRMLKTAIHLFWFLRSNFFSMFISDFLVFTTLGAPFKNVKIRSISTKKLNSEKLQSQIFSIRVC